MNFLKKDHDIVRQNDKIMKTSQKHDANLQKNSTLYFQIGLILVLLAVHGLFEMSFAYEPITISIPDEPIEEEYVFNKKIKVYKEVAALVVPKKKKPIIFRDPIIKRDDDPIIETTGLISEPPKAVGLPIKINEVPAVIDIPEEVNILAVEQVPVYPGCEELTSNLDRRACMQKKLAKLIDRKFDKEIASEYGLSGIQKIYVQFKIDKSGKVTDIKARAPHTALAKEAKKVIAKVPQMQPGKQAKNPVNVIYTLPILFQVDD